MQQENNNSGSAIHPSDNKRWEQYASVLLEICWWTLPVKRLLMNPMLLSLLVCYWTLLPGKPLWPAQELQLQTKAAHSLSSSALKLAR
jgi:hypothetical protein